MKSKLVLIAMVLAAFTVMAGVAMFGAQSSDALTVPARSVANALIYHVAGNAMAPTILEGDRLLVRTGEQVYRPGDIIVFRYPKNKSLIYCRRVIAVAGDRVKTVYYSNVKLTTVYTPGHPGSAVFPVGVTPQGNAFGEYTSQVKPGYMYVVGDDAVPGGSYDSDEWGLLPSSDVIGLVTARIQPAPRSFVP